MPCPATPRPVRIRAPELRGRSGWIGAVGPAPILAGLRGELVLLDFLACCDDAGGHPVCHLTQQDWGLRVRVVAAGRDRLCLVLQGLDR